MSSEFKDPPPLTPTLGELYGGVSRNCFLFTAVALSALLLFYSYLHTNHLRMVEAYLWFLAGEQPNDAIIHRYSTLHHGVAMMLLTGVVLVAPILSLSLHQFHDKIYDTFSQLAQSEYRDQPWMQETRQTLLDYLTKLQKLYGWRNDAYLAIWAAAVILLVSISTSFLRNLTHAPTLFIESVFYLISAMILCSLFAVVAFGFFVGVRPGETKLRLYVYMMKSIHHTHSKHPGGGTS